MERIPGWVLWLFVIVFAGLAIWSFTADYWIGVFASTALAAAFVAIAIMRGAKESAG